MPIFCDFWKRLLWYKQKSSVLWITNLGSQLSFLILPHLLRIWAPYAYFIMYMEFFLCNSWSWRQFIYLLNKDKWNWSKKQSNTFLGETMHGQCIFWTSTATFFQVFPVFFQGKVIHLNNSFFAHIDFKVFFYLLSCAEQNLGAKCFFNLCKKSKK